MKKLRFYKEKTGRWYVDLPDWKGLKEELEMVAGADSMLEHMAEGNSDVMLLISETPFDNSDVLSFNNLATEIESGAFYRMEKYKGEEINLEMWLCDVTLFVFGKFPEKLYVSKVD